MFLPPTGQSEEIKMTIFNFVYGLLFGLLIVSLFNKKLGLDGAALAIVLSIVVFGIQIRFEFGWTALIGAFAGALTVLEFILNIMGIHAKVRAGKSFGFSFGVNTLGFVVIAICLLISIFI